MMALPQLHDPYRKKARLRARFFFGPLLHIFPPNAIISRNFEY